MNTARQTEFPYADKRIARYDIPSDKLLRGFQWAWAKNVHPKDQHLVAVMRSTGGHIEVCDNSNDYDRVTYGTAVRSADFTLLETPRNG